MMRGLLEKTLREAWLSTVLLAGALFAGMGLLTFVLPKVQQGMGEIFEKLPFVKMLLAALVGSEVSGEITAQLMQSILWVHPIVLAVVWAHAIIFCTRVPAAEIDRGTIDLLLGLPVSRGTIYGAETIGWLVSGAGILLLGACGHLLATPAIPIAMRPAPRAVFYIVLNLYCVYLAVGGVAFLVSALSDRRGRAIGFVFAVVLVSFLVNFLAPLWPPAKQAAVLSVMHYYQPAQILRGVGFPWSDIAVLSVAAFTAWLTGAVVFVRRDVCTV